MNVNKSMIERTKTSSPASTETEVLFFLAQRYRNIVTL